MTGTGSSDGCGHNGDSDNFFSARGLFLGQLCENVTDGRDRGAVARAGGDERPRLSALARQLIVLHGMFAPAMHRNVMQEVSDIFSA